MVRPKKEKIRGSVEHPKGVGSVTGRDLGERQCSSGSVQESRPGCLLLAFLYSNEHKLLVVVSGDPWLVNAMTGAPRLHFRLAPELFHFLDIGHRWHSF